MSRPTTGRPSLFRGKDRQSKPVQGRVTPQGRRAFEAARARAAKLGTRYQIEGRTWTPGEVSDGDTIEYLAVGHTRTEQQFKKRSLAYAITQTTQARQR